MDAEALEAKLEDAQVGFAIVEGPSMIFRLANARYQAMVSRTNIVGRPWAEVFPELVDTPVHAAVLRAYEGQRIELSEFPVRLERQGKVEDTFFSFTLDPTFAPDGTVSGYVVIAVEVTELVVRRRQAEELAARVRTSEARFRTLFDAIDDGFCIFEMLFDEHGVPNDYRFLETNEAFLRHTGLPPAVGKTAKELVPDLDESWVRLYGRVALTGEPARFENNAPAMGRWFEVFASRIGEPELHQVGLVFKDVSSRKRVEQRQEDLLNAEQAARRSAEAANRLKDDFLATVSHELRTPLNAMLGWVTLLRSGRLNEEKSVHALETIERNARAQAQLIEDLLDVSSILEGKLRLEVKPIDLRSVVEAAVETVRPAADGKGVVLQVVLSSKAKVMGDAQRLQQVVWNLLTNAVKFTPRNGRVQVLLELNDSAAELSITDNGIGISAEFLPHVFERFRQANSSSTRSQGGLGLGLSIVRHLVEMHGGTSHVSSEGEGQGSRFMIRLPVAVTARTDLTPPAGLHAALLTSGLDHPPELQGVKVVAIDDEEDSRDMLRMLLEECGAAVRTAGSVAEGLRLFSEDRPHVLVSDIGMPNEDGYALIAKVRALSIEEGGNTPVVALTAYARTEDRTRCLLAGFTSHVPKPVEPLELIAVVASLAGRISRAP